MLSPSTRLKSLCIPLPAILNLTRLLSNTEFSWESRRKRGELVQTGNTESERARLTEKGIYLDGRDLLHIETRNMCRCEVCFGKYSQQRPNLPAGGTLYSGVRVKEIGRVSEHYLSLKWSDGHEGIISRTMRGDYGPGLIESRLEKWLELIRRENKAQEFWASPNEEVTKTWDYSWVVESGENTREFLTHYMRYGIGVMSGIPTDLSMAKLLEEGLKIGPLRRTCWNPVDIVRFKPNPNNAGYGNNHLPLHLDLPFYYQTPHVQFFMANENTVEGGESFWVDSFSAIREMSEKRPDLVEVLKTVPVTFRYTPPGTGVYQLTQQYVVNTLGEDVWQTVDNPQSLDPAMFTRFRDTETRERWWEAYTYFRGMVEDPSRRFVKRLETGEFVVTDNWRVYHARREFQKTAPEQERVVSTAYMDWNIMTNRVLSPDEGCSLFLETDQH